jgi:hypothetical protein
MLSNPFENVLRVADHTFDVTVRGNVCGFETLQSANSIVPPLAVAKFVDNGGPYRGLNRSTFR